jgi:hypothetical protein
LQKFGAEVQIFLEKTFSVRARTRAFKEVEKQMPFPRHGNGIFKPKRRHLFAPKKAPLCGFGRSKMPT